VQDCPTSVSGNRPIVADVLTSILGIRLLPITAAHPRFAEGPITPFRLENRLRVARAERGISQEQLADLAGVTRQTISSIETGQYVPSALLAFVLARRLDKPIDALFTLTGDDP
jgi:putative transcriptional regulator